MASSTPETAEKTEENNTKENNTSIDQLKKSNKISKIRHEAASNYLK